MLAEEPAQLMLVMLADGGSSGRNSPSDATDADDAGGGLGACCKANSADADDASGRWGLAVEPAQLMLMMLVGVGGLRKSQPS